ncbi:MAG TPA: AAA family ATPase [Candidatus Limnocylindrales bacterium]|nr:AAA family ATPase [Candidatus Limnocylindrales bacterium]
MNGARTRGQPAALGAVSAMVTGTPPHAVLLSGPEGVGKTTLALDLAAGLLCTAEDPAARPCRECRACRMVDHGNHPDLHWLQPEGPGGQIVIGGPDARYRGVRDLIAELALLPVEGGARVAILERADRMNEDAQSALLKTLEEPPAGVTIVLCANDEEQLLPTVRSRCARIRLGPVGGRGVEEILAEHGLADAPTAARLGRLAGGRPGLAIAYARVPEATSVRAELARALLDLVDARPSKRLEQLRSLVPRASELGSLLARGGQSLDETTLPDPPADAPNAGSETPAAEDGARRVPAAERRRAAGMLIAVWVDVARDLALVAAGERAALRDPALLEEYEAIARDVPPHEVARFIGRLGRGGELLEVNVAPELLLDSLVLAWPTRARAA